MASFTVTMQLDDAAATEDRNAEVARILAELSAFIGRKVCYLDAVNETGALRDVNGNRIGAWEYRA
jgi:hypothetical protein